MEAMLTENQIQRLGRLVRLAPYLDQAMQRKLLDLIRDLKAAEGMGWLPQSAIQPMVDAVGDQQIRDIVNDLRSGVGEPGGFLGPTPKTELRQPPRAKHIPLEPPPGIPIMDEMMDVQDALDKRELEKRLRGG
jgi:hypothetical protein